MCYFCFANANEISMESGMKFCDITIITMMRVKIVAFHSEYFNRGRGLLTAQSIYIE